MNSKVSPLLTPLLWIWDFIFSMTIYIFHIFKHPNKVWSFLFWSWNLIFAVVIYFGFLPFAGPSLFFGLTQGFMNWDFLLFYAVLIFVPGLFLFIGFKQFKNEPKKLLILLFGVELPLLFLSLFRVIFIRDLTPAVSLLLWFFAIGSFSLLYRLLRPKKEGSKENWPLFTGNTILLWCGLWVFCFLLFFVPPAAWETIQTTIQMFGKIFNKIFYGYGHFWDNILIVFLIITIGIFVLYTATLFVFFPFVYVYLAAKNWLQGISLENKRQQYSIGIGILIFCTLIVGLASSQDHKETLVKLQNFDHSQTSKEWFVDNQEEIKDSLVNIYLAPYRYMGDESKINNLQSIYYKSFDVQASSTQWLQNIFNIVARPLIYQGSGKGMEEDQEAASTLYQQFFDGSIQEQEREPIRHAIKATYSWESVEAGLINIGEENVFLEQQTITLEEEGEWATMELHETYVNKAQRRQEVYYSFQLPQGAILTGLWLSETNEKKYKFQVASRGAAQKVYKRIVRQRADPALLEQVGPQLYRLRVFPILANRRHAKEIQKMHMWLQIKMLKNNDTHWQLPMVSEKRNVYWSSDTTLTFQGEEIDREEGKWLPPAIPFANKTEPVTGNFQIGRSNIELKPTTELAPAEMQNMAIIIDSSLSMQDAKEEISKLLGELKSLGNVDLYLAKDRNRLPKIKDAEQMQEALFFGSVNAVSTVQTFQKNHGKNGYDHLVFLTDKSAFQENEQMKKKLALQQPTWFLMVDQKLPRVSGDKLLDQFYQAGGGIHANFADFKKSLFSYTAQRHNPDLLSIGDRYTWKRNKAGKEQTKRDKNLEAFAAQQYIYWRLATGQNKKLSELDQLQKVAKKAGIVSPYSSMIVLVNDAQKKMLKEAEKKKDRFNREKESGKEILSKPRAPFEASAVPEPEEWALIIVALLFFLYHFYRSGYRLPSVRSFQK